DRQHLAHEAANHRKQPRNQHDAEQDEIKYSYWHRLIWSASSPQKVRIGPSPCRGRRAYAASGVAGRWAIPRIHSSVVVRKFSSFCCESVKRISEPKPH